MDAQVIARIMQGNKLSDVMVGALFTGDEGKEIQAGPKQVAALVERDLIDSESKTLSERGEIVLRALKGEELSPEDEAQIYPTPANRYFVFYPEHGDPVIRPYAESEDGEAALSFVDAKDVVVEYATERRDFYRELIKTTRSLRAKDVVGTEDDPDANPDDFDTED